MKNASSQLFMTIDFKFTILRIIRNPEIYFREMAAVAFKRKKMLVVGSANC